MRCTETVEGDPRRRCRSGRSNDGLTTQFNNEEIDDERISDIIGYLRDILKELADNMKNTLR